MNWLKKHWLTILLVAILILGLGLLLYPSFSDYWNSLHQSRAIMTYAQNVANMEEEEYKRILSDAKEYNEKIAENGIIWNLTEEEREEYKEELNIDGTGNMAYIDIPKINVKLPIYHGTDEKTLETSVGHMEGTSLPVGGAGSHCVLSGHRGLPSAKLFSDLDKIVTGDTFSLTVLNETLTYEVDQIRIVEPTDLSDLRIVKEMDYCTLVTCTPYGINTHRLLVRGHRVANPNGDANVIADALQIEPVYIAPFVAAPILIVLLVLLLATTKRKTGGKKDIKANAANAKRPNRRTTDTKNLVDTKSAQSRRKK